MPRYNYDALDSQGKVVQGTIQAPTEAAVIRELQNLRLTITSIRLYEKKKFTLENIISRVGRVNTQTLAIFTRQFATIYNAGVPLKQGLEGMMSYKQTENRKLAEVMTEVHKDVSNGVTLAKALSRHPEVFSPVYISLIRAGEVSGNLGEIMERLATLLEKDYLMQKKIIAALIYPIVVFVFAVLVTFFLTTYIFPSFISLFEGLDVKLPLATRIIMGVVYLAKNPFFIVLSLAGLAGLGYLSRFYFATATGKRQLDTFLLALPVIGSMIRKLAIARFCRTLGILLTGGVSILMSLEVVEKVAGNEVISEALEEIRVSLRTGTKLSSLLADYKIFPTMVSRMVSVGEESGNLPMILQKIAYYYEVELDQVLDSLSTLIEPLTIGILGTMVGGLLIGLFQPIYLLLQKF